MVVAEVWASPRCIPDSISGAESTCCGIGSSVGTFLSNLHHVVNTSTPTSAVQACAGRISGAAHDGISADGLFGRYSTQEILTYWPAVTEMTEDDDYLFFFTASNGVNVIPKRAFADASSLEQFKEAAKSFWSSSRTEQAAK